MKKIFALVLVFALVGAFTAGCSGADPIVGDWTISSVAANGTEMSIEDFTALVGVDVSSYSYSIYEDGTLDAAVADLVQSGTWTNDGDYYTITTGETAMTAAVEGGNLIIDSNGSQLIFSK